MERSEVWLGRAARAPREVLGWWGVARRAWAEGKAQEAWAGAAKVDGPGWEALVKALWARESLLSWVVRWRARAQGEQVAISGAGEERTWAALDARADRLARAMAESGLRRGDVVAVALPNSALWVEAALAVGRLGGRFLPLGTQSKAAELGYILQDSGARLLLVAASILARLGDGWRGPELAVWSEAEAEAAVAGAAAGAFFAGGDGGEASAAGAEQVIMYTSGTTGRPKGAARSVRDVGLVQVLNLIAALDLSFKETLYVCTPLYHAAPWALSALVLGLGGRLVLADGWDGEASIREMEAQGVTAWLVVPTLVRRWLDLPSAPAPSALQKVYSTGAKFPAAWKREATARFGERFFDIYGATEAGIVAVASPRDCATRPESVGRVLPHIAVTLTPVTEPPAAAPAPTPAATPPAQAPAAQGALHVCGQNFLGYTREGGVTAAARFIAVGDIATLDGDYLTILGRTTDMVISGGVNIYPAEVEAALRAHPSVTDAAVVGVPDPVFGEALAAFVVPKEAGLTEAALVAHCDALLSRFKRPKYVYFLEALPVSPQGKVLKRTLRAQWDALHPPSP